MKCHQESEDRDCPAVALYVRGTAKDIANFDQTYDTMVEYFRFTLGHVARETVRTLTRHISQIDNKPKWKYRFAILTVSNEPGRTLPKATHTYITDNSKNGLLIDTED